LKISPSKASRIALTAALLASVGPALGQGQDRPESLLPPGFDEPAAPAPAPAPRPAATQSSGASSSSTSSSSPSAPAPSGAAAPGNSTAAAATTEGPPVDYSRYELPDYAKRSLDTVGVVAWGNPSFPEKSFSRADGRFLQILMRRLDAPVASRWVSIALRRALTSRIDTPRGVNGADFAADRAWLLIRMGESVAARAVVEDVDVENYTPWLYQVGMQAMLANADPGGLCGMADATSLPYRSWSMSRAMCAGLAGEPKKAGELFDSARAGVDAGDIDALLAEKVMGIGAQGRRAVTIEWTGISRLTSWRWGLAIATREDIPDSLYNTVGPQVTYWRALSPQLAPIERVRAAELAAAQGVFSNAGLVDLYAEIEQEGESNSAEVAAARDLRTAFSDGQQEARVKALQTLWAEANTPRTQYARLVLTARAAAGIVPSAEHAADADRLVSSMLTTGYVQRALAWRSVVAGGSDGWAMLAMADANARVSSADFGAYRNAASERKARLALAGLAGLGRMNASDASSNAASLGVAVGDANSWTRTIDAAAKRRDAGTVALLAAVGMQNRNWSSVTPEALFHIVAAYRAVGMENYARMIAIEAIARS
jgi:hypothetical protein